MCDEHEGMKNCFSDKEREHLLNHLSWSREQVAHVENTIVEDKIRELITSSL